MARIYTEDEMVVLRANPAVKEVRANRLSLTYEVRKEIYEAWKEQPGSAVIRNVLHNRELDPAMLGNVYIQRLHRNLLLYGEPKNGCKAARGGKETDDAGRVEALAATGRFVAHGSRVSFSKEFAAELQAEYPAQSIEDGLRKAGIDPNLVGYYAIYRLQKKFKALGDEKEEQKEETQEEATTIACRYSEELIGRLQGHPYVLRATQKRIDFHEDLYWEAGKMISYGYSVPEIMEVYEIPEQYLTVSRGYSFIFRCRQYHEKKCSRSEETAAISGETTEQKDWHIRIQYRHMKALELKVEENYAALRCQIPDLNTIQRVHLCEWIQNEVPKQKTGSYSIRGTLEKVGISKSFYYQALSDPTLLERDQKKAEAVQADIETVRQVVEYGGYPKGSRQVYMQMERITGKHMSRGKIIRLMRMGNLKCRVRKANPFRRQAQERLKTHLKPNLLRRRFRLYRPGEIYLTDVTYMKYGGSTPKKLAYGSASIDSVTGRLYAFNVSEFNNLELVLSTLRSLPLAEARTRIKPLLHTDQGALYLTDEFQELVKELGFEESMSKRGNCWDNAPQERFFSTFKRETDYSQAESLDALKEIVSAFQKYYNEERGQWTRNKMTPVQFENYLNAMSEEEFQAWKAVEEKKYEEMKRRAKEEAVERAKTLGV